MEYFREVTPQLCGGGALNLLFLMIFDRGRKMQAQNFKLNLLALSVAAALGAAPVHAETDNQWYAGLNVQFGKKITPLFVVGYRHANVDNDGDPKGADISLSVGMDGLNSLKLKGFAGSKCTQGELGAGYNFQSSAMLFTGGIQGGHIAGGVDYSMGGAGFSPYLGVNTISCYDEPNNGGGGGGGGYD